MQRRLYSVLGNRQRLDGGAMFGNAPRALWSRWATPDEDNRIDLVCRALLVVEPERNVLLEAGIGAFFEPTLRERYGVVETHHVLLDNLQRIGLSHEDIDVVVLSHLHFDHAGGLLAPYEEGAPPRLLFPRATFVVSRSAWDRATAPHARDRASFIPGLVDLLAATGRLEITEGTSASVLGPGYRLLTSDGHTPGMLLTELEGKEGPLLFAADLVPGTPWLRRSITMGYDRFPELLIDEKSRILEDLVARRGRIFYTHDPSSAASRIGLDDKGQFIATEQQKTLDADHP